MQTSPRAVRLPTSPGMLSIEPLLGTSVRIHPFSFDPTFPLDVRLVRWPDEAAFRAELAALALPRILLLTDGTAPPCPWDELEDWVRAPVDTDELHCRATTVGLRADSLERPSFDHQGLLWFRDRWVAVAPGQSGLVALLVQQFRTVVRDAEVGAVLVEGGASTHAEAVKTAVRRAARCVRPLGLDIERVRVAGYMLTRAP